MELPFVVGIMADLSSAGGAKDEQGSPIALRDKKYLEVDRDNFNDIMSSIKPSVALNGGSATYTFESLEDFTPIRLLKPANTDLNKVDPDNDKTPLGLARGDYGKRSRLSDMVAKLDGNVPLQKKFIETLMAADKRTALKTSIADLKGTLEPPKNPETPVTPTTPKTTETPEGGKKK